MWTARGGRGDTRDSRVAKGDGQRHYEAGSVAARTNRFSPPASRLFRQSGIAVMRQDSHHLLALCCPKGRQGYCAHTHNDFLSFELEAFGRTFIADCGSYVYTQSPEWRNRFRFTAFHNTIVVDRCEQNAFSLIDMFDIGSRVKPSVQHWSSTSERDVLDAAYTLVLPDGGKATHERRFVFKKDRGRWLIRDRVVGCGSHAIETRFHFTEGVGVTIAGDKKYRAAGASGPELLLSVHGGRRPTAHIETGWISRTYAAKEEIRVLRFECQAELPFEQWYQLIPSLND